MLSKLRLKKKRYIKRLHTALVLEGCGGMARLKHLLVLFSKNIAPTLIIWLAVLRTLIPPKRQEGSGAAPYSYLGKKERPERGIFF